MSQNPSEPYELPSGQQLLRLIQEKSDDIEKVVIPQSPGVLSFMGTPIASLEKYGMIIHMLQQRCLIGRPDAELILNDGILSRMGIRIELQG